MVKPAGGRRFIPFAFAAALTVGVSIVAYANRVPMFIARIGLDKILHATMGFTLTFALGRALRGREVLAGVLVFVPVALDEYLQRFSASRTSDWGDLLADIAGITLAIVILKRRSHVPHDPPQGLRSPGASGDA